MQNLTAATAAYSIVYCAPGTNKQTTEFFDDFDRALHFYRAAALNLAGMNEWSWVPVIWMNGRKPGRKSLGLFREQKEQWAAYQAADAEVTALRRAPYGVPADFNVHTDGRWEGKTAPAAATQQETADHPGKTEWSRTLQEAGEIYAARRAARQNA